MYVDFRGCTEVEQLPLLPVSSGSAKRSGIDAYFGIVAKGNTNLVFFFFWIFLGLTQSIFLCHTLVSLVVCADRRIRDASPFEQPIRPAEGFLNARGDPDSPFNMSPKSSHSFAFLSGPSGSKQRATGRCIAARLLSRLRPWKAQEGVANGAE